MKKPSLKDVGRFVNHYGLLALLLAVAVVAPVQFSLHWSDPQRMQVLSTVTSLVIAVLLAAVDLAIRSNNTANIVSAPGTVGISAKCWNPLWYGNQRR